MSTNSNGFDVRHIYFGTDPLWQSYRKVFCQTLKQSITRVQTGNVIAFYLCNRPVSKVEIMGIVLGVEIKDSKVTMFVDDGTAVVRCVKYTYANQIAKQKSQVNTFQGLRDQGYKILVVPDNGDLVLVCGILAIQETNYDPYEHIITNIRIEVLTDPNAELLHWTSAMLLYESAYQKQFELPSTGSMILPSSSSSSSSSSAAAASKLNPYPPNDVDENNMDIVNESEQSGSSSSSSQPLSCSNPFIFCVCGASSSTAAAPKIKQQMLYCHCIVPKLDSKTKTNWLDPTGTFSIRFLQFLLSREICVEPATEPLEFSFNNLR